MLSWRLRDLTSDASLTPSERAAASELAVVRRETAVVKLLQGSARSPEDLLWTAIDLLQLGLLSTEILQKLCTSLGLSGEPLEALLGSELAKLRPDAAAAAAAAPGAELPTAPRSLPGLGPRDRPLYGLSSLGLQSRLASEFVLLRKLGHGSMGSVFHQLLNVAQNLY